MYINDVCALCNVFFSHHFMSNFISYCQTFHYLIFLLVFLALGLHSFALSHFNHYLIFSIKALWTLSSFSFFSLLFVFLSLSLSLILSISIYFFSLPFLSLPFYLVLCYPFLSEIYNILQILSMDFWWNLCILAFGAFLIVYPYYQT